MSAPAHLRSRAAAVPDPDKLSEMRRLAATARDLQDRVTDLERLLTETKETMRRVVEEYLPELMMEARVRALELEAEGNHPAFDVRLSDFYAANIPVAWDEARRREGFAALEAVGAGDLIKTEVTVRIPREAREAARELIETLERLYPDLPPEVKESVHHGQMGAWLKSSIENDLPVPPLEKIGARIGKVAKLKKKD